jgi:hypothetical protein
MSCVVCGDFFTLAYRSASEMRQQGRQPICKLCKRPALVLVTDDMYGFWSDRFSEEEVLWMAECIWGPRETWKLTAETSANLANISQPGESL